MAKFQRESAFFKEEERVQKRSNPKLSKLLKVVGGKKGLLISQILLERPKYKDLI